MSSMHALLVIPYGLFNKKTANHSKWTLFYLYHKVKCLAWFHDSSNIGFWKETL